jgi:hypothetical protein
MFWDLGTESGQFPYQSVEAICVSMVPEIQVLDVGQIHGNRIYPAFSNPPIKHILEALSPVQGEVRCERLTEEGTFMLWTTA